MIIALAGRRIDAARFPLENVELVKGRVRRMFAAEGATALVSAAACGADLIALLEAGALSMRRRVVLPSSRVRFRETSVVDRPGDWGPTYDKVLDEIEAAGELKVKDLSYTETNVAILDEALALAKDLHLPVKAALVWDGHSRGADDVTEHFGKEARTRSLQVIEVSTIK